NGSELVRRQGRREKRAERILIEVRGGEIELARLLREVVFTRQVETAARFKALPHGQRDASKLGHLVFDADIEVERRLVILELIIVVAPGEIAQHRVA